MRDGLPRDERAALTMLAAWMGERFFRTFRPAPDSDRGPFDALLMQRDLRVGITIGLLWDDGETPGVPMLEAAVGGDLEAASDTGAYVLWVPPRSGVTEREPAASDLRLLVSRGLGGLQPGERREVRIPAILRLAKIDAGGSYISVTGGLASEWTHLSENVPGAFHLDSRDIHRLPKEEAEREILIAAIRDRAHRLEVGEFTAVEVHDYWLVSRLSGTEPRGLTIIGAHEAFDSSDAAAVRRLLRAHVKRAEEQRYNGTADLTALLLVGSYAHIGDERVTAGLRGMNPSAYGGIDLVALVADGLVRQVLQPRSLPWESPAPTPIPPAAT